MYVGMYMCITKIKNYYMCNKTEGQDNNLKYIFKKLCIFKTISYPKSSINYFMGSS